MFTTLYNTAIAATATSLLILFTQCSSNLTGDLDIEYEGDRITVNGYLSPDSIRLTVGKTVNFYNRSYSPEELIAPNAQVFLLNSTGEVLYELNSSDRVTFSIPNPHLIVGKNYFVKVTAGCGSNLM